MSRREKFIAKLMGGKSDAGIDFAQLAGLLTSLGFDVRTEGSHHEPLSKSIFEFSRRGGTERVTPRSHDTLSVAEAGKRA